MTKTLQFIVFLSIIFLLLFKPAFSQTTVIIGTGTHNASYPFYTYYHDSRTQMLYTATELNAAGSFPGAISSIAFDVVQVAPQLMNNFSIKIKQTTTSTLSGFETGGFTTVYSGAHSISSAGWNTFNFNTPIIWDGTSNILIDICFDNTSFTTNTSVKSSTASGKVWHKHNDGAAGCTFNTGSGVTYRPNIKFIVSSPSSNDFSVVGINAPVNGATANSSMSFSVEVKNIGSSAQTGYGVKYSINDGNSWKSKAISTSLASYTSATVNFNGTAAASMGVPGIYKCIAVVNRSGDTLHNNDTIRKNIAICGSPYSGTLIVGNGPTDDFPDMSTAISALKLCGISGPINIKIKSGFFNQQVSIGPITGVTSTTPLTIESFTGNANDVIFSHAASSDFDNYVFKLDSCSYVNIKNITMKSTGSNIYSRCIKLYASNNCIIEGNSLIGEESTNVNTASSLLFAESNANFTDISIINNRFNKGGFGAYLRGNNSHQCINTIISGNSFTNINIFAIKLNYSNTYTISSNTIDLNLGKAIHIAENSGSQIVSKNKMITNNNIAVLAQNCNGTSSNPFVLKNNFIHQKAMADNAIRIYSCSYANIFNNSVYSIGTYSNYSCLNIANGSYISIKNNNLINNAGGFAIRVESPSAILESDYNNFYTSTGNYLANWGSSYNSLSSLQAASGKDANSISSNVSFYTNDNLHVIGTTLNGLGTPIASVTEDFDGEARDATNPDIGADEYSVYQNDAGLTEFVNMDNTCPGSSQNISVKINNFGLSGIANVSIGWSVNGAQQANYAWTGLLGLLNGVDAVIGSYSFDADSTYQIKAWVNSVNLTVDSNAINDTVILNNYHTSLAGGTYQIGSSNSSDFYNIQSAIDAISDYGICGPIVFNIENGTYYGNYTIGTIDGVNSTNTITFQSLSGDTISTKLAHINTYNNSYIFYLDNASHINFKNLSFSTDGGSFSRIFKVYNQSNHFTVDSCLFVGLNTLSSSSNNKFLIDCNGSNHVSVTNSTFRYGTRAISITGVSNNKLHKTSISNNNIYGYNSEAIYCNYSSDTLFIRSNVIKGRGKGIFSNNNSGKLFIENNNISITSDYNNITGIFIYNHNYNNYTAAHTAKINNNFIYIDANTSLQNFGILLSYSKQNLVYFNTVKIINNTNNQTSAIKISSSASTSIGNSVLDVGANICLSVSPLNSLVYSNYNSFYSTLASPFKLGYSNFPFAQYKSSSNKDGNSIWGQPVYLNNGDLHIYDVALNNHGTSISGITTDIDGETRSTSSPDIGADEYYIPAIDVALYDVNSPGPISSIGSNEIRVAIKNLGTSNVVIDSLHYFIDNGATTSIGWTGNLTPLAVDSLILIGTENFSAGAHTLKVWSNYPNATTDLNHANDTMVLNFTAQAMPEIIVSPSSISGTTTVCDDSVIVALKIKNTGSATLNYTIDTNTITSSQLQVVILRYGVSSTYYSTINSSLGETFTDYNAVYSNASNVALLQADIAGKDVIIMPYMSSMSYISAYASFATTLQNFVSEGGSVIFAGQGANAYITNTGLWDNISGAGYTTNNSSVSKLSHSITDNITVSDIVNNNDYMFYFSSAVTNYTPLMQRASNKLAGYRTYGNGYVFCLGYRYRYTNNVAESKLISNSLKFINDNSDKWLTVSSATGSVSVGDSTIINVKLNSLGYIAGVYASELVIHSNDIHTPIITVPCTLTVIGTPSIASQTTSINFGSQNNNVASYDSVQVYNDGCGNLLISSITTSNSAYSYVSYGDTVTPGDSTWIVYKFLPTVSGAYAATSTIVSNAANYTVYLSGNSTLAPDITVTPNPLNITIPNCNDSVIVNLQIQNSGGGTLTATVNSSADSAHIIVLNYGCYSSRKNNMINSFGQNFTKYDYMEFSTVSAANLQNSINSFNANVIVIPDISASFVSNYSSLATVLQNFATNGGTVIFGGGYNDGIFVQTGLISASRINNDNYVNLVVQNVNNPLTLNFSPTINTSNEYIIYFNFSGTGITSLLKFNGNDVAVRKEYGNGQVIVLGHYFNALPTNYSYHQQLLSNSIKSAATGASWMSFTNTTANLSAGSTAQKEITFKSEGLASGTYVSSIKINTNSPLNPMVIVPCTLTVQNQMANGVDLGNDTASCGSVILDAGAGFASYAWNTGNTTQTITAVSSGTYSVTVGSGGPCSSSDTIIVVVVNSTTATITGLPTSACSADPSITLTGFPAGGVFSGPGMSGNVFSPPSAGTGTHSITYTFTGSTCSSSTNEQIFINTSPVVTFSGLGTSYCPNDPATNLIGTPPGGVFTGNGVVGNSFYPNIAGLGTHSVMYAYTVGGCSNSDTNTTFIGNSSVNINIAISQTNYCINDNAVSLSATPSGGVFSGNGVSGNSFDPTVAGEGTHYIKYIVSSATSCDALDSVLVTVLPAPTGMAIFNLPANFCHNDAAVTINGFPAGGVFSGYGMTGNTFSPTNANIGTHYIYYTITGSNGCSGSAKDSTKVLAPPTITFTNMQNNYCENDDAISIVVTPTGGTLTGTGLLGNLFDPSTAALGSHSIYYSYTDANSCSNNDSFNIVIYSSPSSLINPITASFCETSPAVNVSGTPTGGVFFGNGVTGNSFSPVVAGLGTHYVKYKVTDNNGCSDVDSTTAVVNAAHTVDAGSDVSISYNTTTQLSGSISGGNGNFTFSWTPASSVANSSQLSSSTTNLTTSTAFTLNVLDNVNACSNSDQIIVTITGGALAGNLTASASTICEGESSNLLALGSGGSGNNYTYSWTSSPVGFSSTIANPVVKPIVNTTYTCTIGDGVNSINEDVNITVNASPNATISNLDTVYCDNDAVATLSVSPAGGTLSGGGISGLTFNPTTAPLGPNVVIYSLTGSNGCYGADTIIVAVGQVPSVYAGNDTILPCSNNGLLLGQQPIGGVSYQWLPIAGLTDANIANPALTINASMNYTLTATHNITGCSNTDQISIQLTGAPTAVASNDTTICINSSATLYASGGSTYFWNNGVIGTTNTVSPLINTLYYVIVTDAGCSTLDTVWVMVNNPKPDLGIDTSVCGSQSYTLDAGSFSTYYWSNGATSQTITVDSTGIGYSSIIVNVDVADNIGCIGKDTVIVTFINCTGINDIDNNSFVMSVFPNPSSGKFTIRSNETAINNLNLEILDMNGRVILQKRIVNVNGTITDKVDLSNHPSGVYLVRLSNGKLVKTFKVVVN